MTANLPAIWRRTRAAYVSDLSNAVSGATVNDQIMKTTTTKARAPVYSNHMYLVRTSRNYHYKVINFRLDGPSDVGALVLSNQPA